jgi:hypothetical protein
MSIVCVMKHYTKPQAELAEGEDPRKYIPRFYFTGENAEAEALALSASLNRAMTTWHALANLPPERKGPDHLAQLARAEATVKRKDAQATADSRYLVESSVPYDGPVEDFTPVITAMMQAFNQLPDPPPDYFTGLFRLIGAASPIT